MFKNNKNQCLEIKYTAQSDFWFNYLSSILLCSFRLNYSPYSSSIDGTSNIKTWPLTDLSGYFVTGYDSSTSIAKICKYTFSTLNAQCQSITNINVGYGHLMVSNSQFFVLGVAPASPYNLQMYKIAFSLTSVDWAKQITCTSETWFSHDSESLLSSDKSTIYSFFSFWSPTFSTSLYFVGLSVLDGSARTSRYKANTYISDVLGSALNGDYVVATTQFSTYLIIYSISSSQFTIKYFFGMYLYGWGVEPSSGR